ncbi:MAG: hypothetical protein WCF50_09990, partial [Pseudolabrys sp.]
MWIKNRHAFAGQAARATSWPKAVALWKELKDGRRMQRLADVRFTPESGHSSTRAACPLGAN